MKLDFSRIAWSFAFLTFASGATVTLLGASTVRSSQDEASAAQSPAAAPSARESGSPAPVVTTSAANSCLSDPVVLDEISKKRQEIEARQKELQAKDAELKARESAINDELKKLQDLRAEITQLDEAHRKENQDKIAKVIETLQSMSPKASAQFLTTLDDGLAVAAISQMDTAKLAKIMNTIDPKRGARLTELLAGVVRAKPSTASSHDAAETTSPSQQAVLPAAVASRKGGEKNDTSNKAESIISGGPDLATKTQ